MLLLKYNNKMSRGYLKNSIISLILTISFIVMPFGFIPRKTEAQNISSYIGGLSGVIPNLPLCKDKMANGLKNLFNGTNGLDYTTVFPEASSDASAEGFIGPAMEDGTLEQKSSDAIDERIPIALPPSFVENTRITRLNTEETKKSVRSLDESDTCLKSIGRAVAKMLLQKITLSTVEWINGGYDGSPKFIQNAGEFWGDMAKNEIFQFGVEIGNPELFPFGRAFMQKQARAFKTKFAQNAEYSLNKLIQDTNPQFSATTFEADFSMGGWSAWDAMTQVPANNPLGFNLMASNELQKRLEGTSQSNAQDMRDALQQARGYLGTEMCTYPDGVDKQEHEMALQERAEYPDGSEGLGVPITRLYRLCERWEYVTPGGMVADAATKLVNYPDNNLLRVDDLNDAVAAILDAMLNSFIPEINSDSGFANLQEMEGWQSASEGNFLMGDYETFSSEENQVDLDFTNIQIASSSFLQANLDFNIRTDLTQAIVDEQRIFIEKIKEQNTELKLENKFILPTKDNSFYTGNSGLIPVIYQLDYCIPGPHPNFEVEARISLSAALETIRSENKESMKDQNMDDIEGAIETILPLAAAAAGAAIGAAIGSGFPVIGTVIGMVIGAAVGYLSESIDWSSAEKRLKTYYMVSLRAFTGLNTDIDSAGIGSKTEFNKILYEILERYIEMIYDVYKIEKMPSVTQKNTEIYKNVKGYNQIYENNKKRIVIMQSVTKRLEGIKHEIDRLNCEVNPDSLKTGCATYITQDQYNKFLIPWISAFGRISAEMVNGNDIAVVENTIKQIKDEKDYIYNILLKGPNGCEKELAGGIGLDGPGKGLPWQIYNTKRMEYPGPILYDYNNWYNSISGNKNNIDIFLPDPFNSGYANKMPGGDLNNKGPGFLGDVLYTSGDVWVYDDLNSGRLHRRLDVHDIIDAKDEFHTAVSMQNPNINGEPFEPMNGVYNGFLELILGIY